MGINTNNNSSSDVKAIKADNYIVKAYNYTCRDCKHEWLSRKEDQYCCPGCKSTYLIYQKLY